MSHTAAMLERTLDAEQAVLSCILQSPEVLGAAAAIVAPADFQRPRHALIFAAMLEVQVRDWLADLLTVATRLDERSELDAAGGKDFLALILDAVPSPVNVAAYAGIVQGAAQRRELAKRFEQGATLAREGQVPPAMLAANMRTALQNFERATDAGARRFALYDAPVRAPKRPSVARSAAQGTRGGPPSPRDSAAAVDPTGAPARGSGRGVPAGSRPAGRQPRT